MVYEFFHINSKLPSSLIELSYGLPAEQSVDGQEHHFFENGVVTPEFCVENKEVLLAAFAKQKNEIDKMRFNRLSALKEVEENEKILCDICDGKQDVILRLNENCDRHNRFSRGEFIDPWGFDYFYNPAKREIECKGIGKKLHF